MREACCALGHIARIVCPSVGEGVDLPEGVGPRAVGVWSRNTTASTPPLARQELELVLLWRGEWCPRRDSGPQVGFSVEETHLTHYGGRWLIQRSRSRLGLRWLIQK